MATFSVNEQIRRLRFIVTSSTATISVSFQINQSSDVKVLDDGTQIT